MKQKFFIILLIVTILINGIGVVLCANRINGISWSFYFFNDVEIDESEYHNSPGYHKKTISLFTGEIAIFVIIIVSLLASSVLQILLILYIKQNKIVCTTGDIAKGKADRRERKRKNRIASLQRQLSQLEGDGDKHIEEG